jgi:aminoglycoside 6-adenylyltransferase
LSPHLREIQIERVLLHAKYDETVEEIISWAEQDSNVEGAIVIGSQVRHESGGDEWSDLDIMVLANDPGLLLETSGWLDRFGTAVCVFVEVTPLRFADWDWCVKRALYDDNRTLDLSILPYTALDKVLSTNATIMSKGYRVVYDSKGDLLESRTLAALETVGVEKPLVFTEEQLRNDVDNLLFHIIWSLNKIKRKELWTAVRCINSYMRDLLLRLIECHNASVTKRSSVVMYDGRLLEERTDKAILDKLTYCFARYDESDAIDTLGHLIDIVYFVSKEVFEAEGYDLDPKPFETIRQMYGEIKAA